MNCPPICCPCTHRRYSTTPEVEWSGGLNNGSPQAFVLDSAVAPDGELYLVGAYRNVRSDPWTFVVEKWTSDGDRVWQAILPLVQNGASNPWPISITSDSSRVWVAIEYDAVLIDNLYQLDAFTGEENWAIEILNLDIKDIIWDADGEVIVVGHASALDAATIARYDVDGNRIDFVLNYYDINGVDIDASGNVYITFDSWWEDASGCNCSGFVAKLNSSFEEQWVWYPIGGLQYNYGYESYPSNGLFIKVVDTSLFVIWEGRDAETGELMPPELQKWDITTTPPTVEWVTRPELDLVEETGDLECSDSTHPVSSELEFRSRITDMDANDAYVFVAMCHWIFMYDWAGTLVAALPHGRESSDQRDPAGRYFTVTADAEDPTTFYAGGTAWLCEEDDPDVKFTTTEDCHKSSGGDGEGCPDCLPECGRSSYVYDVDPDACGVIIKGECPADDPVPCVFTSTMTINCASEGPELDISWSLSSREPCNEIKWDGVSDSFCTGSTWFEFETTRNCETSSWSIRVWLVYNSGFTRQEITSFVTIDETWCGSDAPGIQAFPGFRFSFTAISPLPAHLDSCCGGELTGCGGFGDPGDGCAGIDACGCTGIPRTLTATITCNAGPTDCSCAHNQTIPLPYLSGTTWEGTGTICGVSWTISVDCLDPDWRIQISACSVNVTGESSETCSPFEVAFNNLSVAATCLGGGGADPNGSINVILTA